LTISRIVLGMNIQRSFASLVIRIVAAWTIRIVGRLLLLAAGLAFVAGSLVFTTALSSAAASAPDIAVAGLCGVGLAVPAGFLLYSALNGRGAPSRWIELLAGRVQQGVQLRDLFWRRAEPVRPLMRRVPGDWNEGGN
jgi:hypothetical protein